MRPRVRLLPRLQLSDERVTASGRGRNFLPSMARLSPAPRRYLQTLNGVELPPPGGRGRGRGGYWIVSRGLCRFYLLPLLPGAPRARQIEAHSLEIKRLSPFVETGSHLHLDALSVGVWLWDQQATRAAAMAVDVDVARLPVVPEPAMYPPGDDGVRLIETLDGVEGQYWVAGRLLASRWWREPPSERNWVLFQRGAGVPAERLVVNPPPPLHLPWLPRPWTTTRWPLSFNPARADLRLTAASIAAAMLVAYAYQGVQWARVSSDLASISGEVETRSRAIEPLLAARTQALDGQTAIRALQALDRFPGQLSLMARIAQLLPAGQTRLTEWIYDRGQLELGIAADRPLDVVALVRSLEGLDHFKSVAAERTGTNNSLRLRVTLDPL